MIRLNLLVFLATVVYSFTFAQDVKIMGIGGGPANIPNGPCLSEEDRSLIKEKLAFNIDSLTIAGVLGPINERAVTLFEWPVKPIGNYPYFNYYGVSGFVDHNPAFPNQLTDYNCGQRTYDVASGYNHKGVDIFLWPFKWNMVNTSMVEAIAAAPGVIIYKQGNQFDRNCSFNQLPWNAVYLRHDDGSETWYGHLKQNSLTNKPVGSSVEEGEYLGIIASSGNSTGPHLHFEVYDGAGNLIDPYQGPCNSLNTESWWKDQKPYYEKRMNMLMTHSAPPQFPTCPQEEQINESRLFEPGQTAFFAGYYQDMLLGDQTAYRILRPDGSEFASWTFEFSLNHLSASYWWWSYALPSDAACGEWIFEAEFEGEIYQRSFSVRPPGVPEHAEISGGQAICNGAPCTELTVFPSGNYQWSTGETEPQITVCAGGVYSVTVEHSSGCILIDSTYITYLEAVEILYPNIYICEGEELLLPGPPGFASYQWSTGETTPYILINEAGEYCVTITDNWGCVNHTCARVFYIPAIERSISGNPEPVAGVENTYLLSPSPDLNLTSIFWEITNGQIIFHDFTEVIVVWDDEAEVGELCVRVVEADGCENLYCFEVDLNSTSTRSTAMDSWISINPIPASDEITIESYLNNKASLFEIVDVNGRQWKMGELTSIRQNVNISDLIPGIYFCRVILNDSEIQVKKIIKY